MAATPSPPALALAVTGGRHFIAVEKRGSSDPSKIIFQNIVPLIFIKENINWSYLESL